MKMKIIWGIKLLSALFICVATADVQAQTAQITVSGIRSAKGQVILKIFRDEKAYEDEKPFKTIPFEKKALSNGTLVLDCKLDPGTYGITVLDDENKNGKIEKSFVGIPKEGFGFSNFFMEKMKKPTFSDFKTDIKSGNNKIEIKVKYM